MCTTYNYQPNHIGDDYQPGSTSETRAHQRQPPSRRHETLPRRTARQGASSAEAQPGERSHGIRVGSRLLEHTRLELRLGGVARAHIEGAELQGHVDSELGRPLAQVHGAVGAHLPVHVEEQALRLRGEQDGLDLLRGIRLVGERVCVSGGRPPSRLTRRPGAGKRHAPTGSKPLRDRGASCPAADPPHRCRPCRRCMPSSD